MNCEYCQSPVHIWFQCPKKPDGWKPARLAKKSTALLKEASAGSVRGKAGREKVAQPEPVRTSQAGTQALPVDTNSVTDGGDHSPNSVSSNTSAGTVGNEDRQLTSEPHITAGPRAPDTGVAGNHPASRGPGEENGAPKFDKKAWMKAYMKTYLRQYRTDVKAGKRTPKPRA